MKALTRSLALLSLTTLTLVGCGANSPSSTTDSLKVVTTTDVYADIVQEIAGDHAQVTPLISSTSQDPHSYEATAADRLAVKDADIIVLNGGGYDQFLEDMAGTDNPDQKVINAVETSGLFSDQELKELTQGHQHSDEEEHHHDHGSLNEHVWYNLEAMKKLSADIEKDLSQVDDRNAETYAQNAESFGQEIDKLKASAQEIKGQQKHFISTEPVPNYLLETTGMEDLTPADFTAAIEGGSDIAPLTLQAVKDQLKSGEVTFLGYNEQTSSNQTKELLKIAEDQGIANASFTETLPEGKNYLDWMRENIANINQALEK